MSTLQLSVWMACPCTCSTPWSRYLCDSIHDNTFRRGSGLTKPKLNFNQSSPCPLTHSLVLHSVNRQTIKDTQIHRTRRHTETKLLSFVRCHRCLSSFWWQPARFAVQSSCVWSNQIRRRSSRYDRRHRLRVTFAATCQEFHSSAPPQCSHLAVNDKTLTNQ